MKVAYSVHAERRMRQRGVTRLEVAHVLKYPLYVKKSFEGRREAVGKVKNRTIMVKFVEMKNYIKIITVI